jgi:hypothetical protein
MLVWMLGNQSACSTGGDEVDPDSDLPHSDTPGSEAIRDTDDPPVDSDTVAGDCQGPYAPEIDVRNPTCVPIELYLRTSSETCFRRVDTWLDNTFWGDWPAVPCDDGSSEAARSDPDGGCYFFPRTCEPITDDPWFSACQALPCDCASYQFREQGLCEGEEPFDTDAYLRWPSED